jgi:hypothetical protein
VQIVVHANVHCYDVVSFEEFMEIRVGGRNLEFRSDPLQFSLVHVCYGNYFRVWDFRVTAKVELADLSHADDADANFGIHFTFLSKFFISKAMCI